MRDATFAKDYFRHYGTKKIPFRKWDLNVVFIYYFRKLKSAKSSLAKLFYRFKLKKLRIKTFISIPNSVEIGDGLYIGHYGRIIINQDAILGKNVNLSTGIVIGGENRGPRKGSPVIGNSVWIGSNAVIVGKITIGDDVLIAPLSFVNFDVPSHSVVIGNPAKIIHNENATKGYVENIVD